MDLGGNENRCEVVSVGKQRNGASRYWCLTHQASATAKYGKKLERCEGAYLKPSNRKVLELDPENFRGGIAIWGAVRPVYDTTGLPDEEGVHVHARRLVEDTTKEHDDTFDTVAITVKRDLFESRKILVSRETAVASYISQFLERPMQSLFCTYCGTPHLDSEWYAVKLHKRHLCHACGKLFTANERSVSNPLAELKFALKDDGVGDELMRAPRSLRCQQTDYPGGVQIWASNPALLWTARRAEESGIHFHGYARDRIDRIEDDTFDQLTIDGITLNEQHLRYYMAQSALRYLDGKIATAVCACGHSFFDQGQEAFTPRQKRNCTECGVEWVSPMRKKVVLNPFLTTIAQLHQNQNELRR